MRGAARGIDLPFYNTSKEGIARSTRRRRRTPRRFYLWCASQCCVPPVPLIVDMLGQGEGQGDRDRGQGLAGVTVVPPGVCIILSLLLLPAWLNMASYQHCAKSLTCTVCCVCVCCLSHWLSFSHAAMSFPTPQESFFSPAVRGGDRRLFSLLPPACGIYSPQTGIYNFSCWTEDKNIPGRKGRHGHGHCNNGIFAARSTMAGTGLKQE